MFRRTNTSAPPHAYSAAFTVLFEPSSVASLETFASTKNYLVLEVLDTVKSKYAFWRYVAEEGVDRSGRWVFCGEEECELLYCSQWLVSCYTVASGLSVPRDSCVTPFHL